MAGKVKRAKPTKSKPTPRTIKVAKPAAAKVVKLKPKVTKPKFSYYLLTTGGLAVISESSPKTAQSTTGFSTFEAAKSHAIDSLIESIELLEAQLWTTKRAADFEEYQELTSSR